jgi:hypothetical protein
MIRKTKKIMAAAVRVSNQVLIIITLFFPAILAAQETNQYAGARLTSGRITSLVILAIGIIGLIIGYKSSKRPLKAPAVNTKRRAMTALILGLLCAGLSFIRLINSSDFGTGGGKAGSIVSLVAGGIAMTLAGKAFYRLQKIKTS